MSMPILSKNEKPLACKPNDDIARVSLMLSMDVLMTVFWGVCYFYAKFQTYFADVSDSILHSDELDKSLASALAET